VIALGCGNISRVAKTSEIAAVSLGGESSAFEVAISPYCSNDSPPIQDANMTVLTSSSGLSGTERPVDDNRIRLVTCCPDELHPHPSYTRHNLAVNAWQLSAVAELGNLAFREPLSITQDRIILDGLARWELARLIKRLVLPCVEYELTEEEAIRWLLEKHRRSNGMNDFCRILLARELEPCFEAKALSNQRFGGRMKGSSNLPEDAIVDVRKEIAAAAGVSLGNVTKVKKLVGIGHPELLEALRGGEVSIHRAWKWVTESPIQQIKALRTYRAERGLNKSIRNLISGHKQKQTPTAPDLGNLTRRLAQLEPHERDSVIVALIRAPGKVIFVTEELVQSLHPYQESMTICTAKNH
jgi:hypothetical protein